MSSFWFKKKIINHAERPKYRLEKKDQDSDKAEILELLDK